MAQSDQDKAPSPRLKFETALDVLSGNCSIDEIARERNLNYQTIKEWVDQLEEAGHRVFDGSNGSGPSLTFDERIESYIEAVPEMVLVLDEDGTIVRANSVLLDKLGYRPGDLEGQTPDKLLVSESLGELITGKPGERRSQLENRTGDPVPVTLSVATVSSRKNRELHLCFARSIEDLKTVQKRLEREKNRFRALYDEAPVGLWEQDMSEARRKVQNIIDRGVDDLRTYFVENPEELRDVASSVETLSVNQQLLDILGARDRDHLLANLNNVFTEETFEVFRDEMVKFFEEGRTSYRSEVTVQTVDGEPRTVLFSLNNPEAPADDWSWVFVTYRDITERKRVQEELAKNEERFRQLAENIESIFWIQSLEEPEVVYISPAVKEITGRSRRFFVREAEAFLDIVHPEDTDRVTKAFRNARDNNFLPPAQYEEEYRIVKPDGEVRWLRDRAFPVRDDDGNVYRVAGIAEDVTERKTMERKIEESLTEKETLLREVHHRVKNNMQIISSLLRLQSYQVEDDTIREEFLDCQQRVRSMVMVHERLYQSDSLADLDVAEYLKQLVDGLINSYSRSRDPELVFDVDEDLDLPLDDTIACGLIINELVSNSLEHGFDSSVVDPTITLSLKQLHDTVRLTVSDNGTGPPEDFTAAETNSLGLQLIESITATQLNGDYEFRKEGGTTVEVTFPNKRGDRQ